MKKISIGIIIILILLMTSGCIRINTETFSKDLEEINIEIKELQKELENTKAEINQLNEANLLNIKEIELQILSKEKIRLSAEARVETHEDTFYNLTNIYKIKSNYEILDDWYVIEDEYFNIELLGYEDAKKVEFYIQKINSAEKPWLMFSDEKNSDGWSFEIDKISQLIDKQRKPFTAVGTSYEPYFVIYAEVTFENGDIIKTSRLPIYNISE